MRSPTTGHKKLLTLFALLVKVIAKMQHDTLILVWQVAKFAVIKNKIFLIGTTYMVGTNFMTKSAASSVYPIYLHDEISIKCKIQVKMHMHTAEYIELSTFA